MGCCGSREEPPPSNMEANAKPQFSDNLGDSFSMGAQDSYGLRPGVTRMLKAEFREHDKDGSGFIDTKELEQIMNDRGIKLSKTAFQAMLKTFGEKRGILKGWSISERGYIMAMAPWFNADPEHALPTKTLRELRERFSAADKDGSGSIDQKELKPLLKGLGMQTQGLRMKQMLETFDMNRDGLLSFEEFVRAYALTAGNADAKF